MYQKRLTPVQLLVLPYDTREMIEASEFIASALFIRSRMRTFATILSAIMSENKFPIINKLV